MENIVHQDLIKAEISKFYIKPTIVVPKELPEYFNYDGTYNFPAIYNLLNTSTKNLTENTYEYYLSCYSQALVLFIKSEDVIKNVPLDGATFRWYGENFKHFRNYYNETTKIKPTPTEFVLILTSILDNVIGNVYYSKVERGPTHLLSDVLLSKHLENIFGAGAMLFLRLIFGSPYGINLRNIAWHGFPKPDFIPSYYVSVLLLTMHTLGSKLSELNFNYKEREKVDNFESNLMVMYKNKIDMKFFNGNGKEVKILMSCNWLHEEYKLYWRQIFQYYKNKKYWQFVILALPQIELLLRLIYGKANNYDVSAKYNEYYITLDTIIADFVPIISPGILKQKNKETNATVDIQKRIRMSKQPNQLITNNKLIKSGAVEFIYDLFISPKGVRLRDKVSHGQAHINAINNKIICNALLHLSLNLLSKECDRQFSLDKYISKFHLNYLLKDAFVIAMENMKNVVNNFLESSDIYKVLNTANSPKKIDFKSLEIKNIFNCTQMGKKVNLIIYKIILICINIFRNYYDGLNERFGLLERHELHTKRRRTLENVLSVLPDIISALYELIQRTYKVVAKLQKNKEEHQINNKIEKTIRELRLAYCLCENLEKCTHNNKNHWSKCLAISIKLKDYFKSKNFLLLN